MKHNNIAALAKLGLFSLLMMITTTAVNAQKQFTLEDLNFGGNNYHNMVPKNRYLTWWGDQLVRRNTDECSLVNKQNGKETVMFTVDDINKWAGTDDSTKIRHLFYASFPYPNKSLVLITGKKDRMLIDFKSKKVVWRQNCEGENFAEWNAASKAVAFVKDDNLFVTNGEGKTTQLTTDGSREIVYGQSVHRDEFGIYKGTFWSPDGQSLAFYRMDQSMVADYPLVNIDTRIATETPIKYPMAGETSHKVTVGVYNLKTGKTIYLKAGDPTDRYFTNIAWGPDCKKVYMIELNRDQTDMQLVSYDATTGNKLETLYKEHNDKYVHPMTPITFLPWDDSKFILQSEKDGYNHLYLFNTKGEQLKQITSGKWIVLDLVGFNKSKKSAIILSTECSPIQNNLYMVNIETGKRTLLDNGKGFHATTRGAGGHCDIILSGTGKYIYDNYSEPDVPRKINIISTENAKNVNYFTAADPWKGYNVPEYSCGTIKAADGTTDLYYRMVKPVNFDPNKKYPTIVYVYGGPGIRNVEARWHYASRGWETYMAQKGYLLFILDNRGSCDRGRDFEQATFRHLGVEEMKDQIKGVEYLKSLAYVDTTRLGVHGWSFGGFMTTSLMTTYPDVFKVGVAGGPVIDWKWYEVMYGERYMDTPQANPEGYAETSLINKAKNLKGKLQIIIGTDDPTVVPQHAISFLKACIEAGTQPDFFVYPGEGHNMMGHQSVHLHERITQYFEDYLK
ncbi:S9 family peptidase [uncultured Prevotella sp.]|uniref:S9 family peptidase n=1 Tax=uncultured Prevotella sp. TaxID=159272 RepID=UPI0025F1F4AD|nr:S9 family peptidase [uncultured Prevotella sp.]